MPYADLAAALPDDPYVRWEVVPQRVGRVWTAPGAVVWEAPSPYHGKPWLTAVGGAGIADLLRVALADGSPAVGVSVPDALADTLPPDLRPARYARWTWWWTEEAPPGSDDPRVVRLTGEEAALTGLLDQSSSVYLRPGDPRVRSWHGVVDGESLRACLAVEEHQPGVPHLASVVVDRASRREGLGRALCGTVVRGRLAAGAPAVSLAMMTANRAAAALYEGLGFSRCPANASGSLPGRAAIPVNEAG